MLAHRAVSLLVCPNGFGHFKRAALLSARLLSAGCRVRVLTRGEKWAKFCKSSMPYFDQIDKVEVVDCAWLPIAQDYENGLDYRSRFDELVKGEAGRLIVSDNYPEPFLSCDNVVVFANFFWHEVFDMPVDYRTAVTEALRESHVTLTSSMFAQSHVMDLPNFKLLPLFGSLQPQVPARGYVVLALGSGSWTNGYGRCFQKFLDFHAEIMPPRIVVDSSLKGKIHPPRNDVEFLFRPFTHDLIAGAEAIIGRPSVGIVTDAMALHVPLFPLADDSDKESLHNSKVIGDIYATLEICPAFNQRIAMRQALKTKSPEFGGEVVLADLILDRVA